MGDGLINQKMLAEALSGIVGSAVGLSRGLDSGYRCIPFKIIAVTSALFRV